MNAILAPITSWPRDVVRGWDRFWFTPSPPHTLAAIRILGGAMLLYTHAVWTINLDAFLGPHSWLTSETVSLMNRGPDDANYALSYLYWVRSPTALWMLHFAALAVIAMLIVGLFTRATSVLVWIITLSYCHRLTGTLFGLDQINAFIATYLMFGDSGGVWSLDRWLAAHRGLESPVRSTIGTNIAIRLLQLHMCVIYLFGGIGKMRGEMWWDGSALWFAFANLEYQSLDMTWMVKHRWLLALLTHVTVFWETFYCFFVWPKLTRPICLTLAVLVHLGIAVCLGMKTFGLVMIIGNIAFVYPETVRHVVSRFCRRAATKDAPPTVTLERAPTSRRQPLAAASSR
jgi:Vitamin K-dependent gamma-carboxylase